MAPVQSETFSFNFVKMATFFIYIHHMISLFGSCMAVKPHLQGPGEGIEEVGVFRGGNTPPSSSRTR